MIRFFCYVTEEGVGAWSDLAFEYVEGFVAYGQTVRVIPIGTADFSEESRWFPYQDLFMTPVDTGYINVVCAGPNDLRTLHTIDVTNVAITKSNPFPHDAEIYEQYDCIIVPDETSAEFFKQLDVTAVEVIPPDQLKRCFRGEKQCDSDTSTSQN